MIEAHSAQWVAGNDSFRIHQRLHDDLDRKVGVVEGHLRDMDLTTLRGRLNEMATRLEEKDSLIKTQVQKVGDALETPTGARWLHSTRRCASTCRT